MTPARIVGFTPGGKGGTGKTTILEMIAEWFRHRDIEPLLLDADHENRGKAGCLNRYYGGRLQTFDVRNPVEISNFVLAALKADSPVVLADFPAASGRDLVEWFRVVKRDLLATQGIRMIAITPLTPDVASFESLIGWADMMQDAVDYLICFNVWPSQRPTIAPSMLPQLYPWYFETAAGKAFRDGFRPHEVIIPALLRDYAGELMEAGATVSAALRSQVPIGVNFDLTNFLHRAFLEQWQHTILAQLDTIAQFLLPGT